MGLALRLSRFLSLEKKTLIQKNVKFLISPHLDSSLKVISVGIVGDVLFVLGLIRNIQIVKCISNNTPYLTETLKKNVK